MIFNDGVETDSNGFFLACPKCGNPDFPKNARKCGCGAPRRNFCLPENKKNPVHVNPPNARFCEICGAETVLFHDGILKPWREALDEIRFFHA